MSKLSDLLNDPAGAKHYAALAFGYHPLVQRAAFFPFSSDGFAPPPTDPAAPNTHFAPRLKEPPVFERSLFSAGKLSGRSTATQTQIVAVSADGAIDHFYDFAWGGRPLDFFIGGEGFAFAEYGYIMRLVMEEPAFTDETITFPLRDITILLDIELQRARYQGTGGAEGTRDLAGRLKPEPWGVCLGIPPVYLGLANGRHTFGLASGPIVGVLAVYDRGSPLTYAADPASPQPGEYVVDVQTGTLTLGGAFDGPIQVDVIGRRYLSIASSSTVTISGGTKTFAVAAGAVEQQFSVGMRVRCLSAADPAGTWLEGVVTTPRPGGSLAIIATAGQSTGATAVSSWIICACGTAAGILCAMAETLAGTTTITDTASRVALNNIQPATVGYWMPEGGNGLQLLDVIAEGAAAYWMITRNNTFRVGRVDVPAGEPVATLTQAVITTLERVSMEAPPSEIALNYARRWSTLSTDQIAGVANATRFTQDRSILTGSLAQAKADYPSAKPIAIETIFIDSADVFSELFRQVSLFGVRRDYFKITMKVGFLSYALTNVVFIQYPRYGLAAGKLMVIIDIKEDYQNNVVELGVWG